MASHAVCDAIVSAMVADCQDEVAFLAIAISDPATPPAAGAGVER